MAVEQLRQLDLTTSPPSPPPPPPPPAILKKAPTKRRLRSVDLHELGEMLAVVAPELKGKRPAPPAASVTIEPPKARQSPALTMSPVRQDPTTDAQWQALRDFEGTVAAIRDRFAKGLPDTIRFTYMPEVLALEGMDFEIVEDALRNPERVDIAPETFDKKYPVLRFHRGDVCTVLGLRISTSPAIIAAYVDARLMHDTHRVSHTGGGGSKQTAGVPTNARALITALRNRGARLPDDVEELQSVEVIYKGQVLGKVSVGATTPKATIETDYQRTQRRMHAIDRRQS